ncbi:MerR family transcriptional regulator [Priestia megaterium]
MNIYTANELTELLQEYDPTLKLRTIRYYTQLSLLPPLELVGNKRVYTDKHLIYGKAILTLTRTGETLGNIHNVLKDLSYEDIERVANQLEFISSENVLHQETHLINASVAITLDTNLSPAMKQKVIQSVSQLFPNGDSHNGN